MNQDLPSERAFNQAWVYILFTACEVAAEGSQKDLEAFVSEVANQR